MHNTNAATRSATPQVGGVWSNSSSWIVTSPQTDIITLTHTSAGVLHGPNDYLRLPDFQITSVAYNPTTDEVALDYPDVNNLTVNVQKATDISTNSWSTLFGTPDPDTGISGETDLSAYYHLEPLTP
ncbi:MAG: hypothetical protein OSA48_12155 [Akkermansiaceae bacterium]|nr:hypothetical protein [Akkermansiaceae bacterium]